MLAVVAVAVNGVEIEGVTVEAEAELTVDQGVRSGSGSTEVKTTGLFLLVRVSTLWGGAGTLTWNGHIGKLVRS